MPTRRASLTLLLTAGLAAACAPPAPDPHIAQVEAGLAGAVMVEGDAQATRTVEEAMAAYGVPGMSVAVVDGGELAWTRSYGVQDVETAFPVTDTTLFQAASISKPLTALAALQLVEAGTLTLDDDVGRWLTSWQVPAHPRHPGDVTLRRLLTHSAGLTVHGFPGYDVGEDAPTTVQVLNGEGNTPAIVVDTTPGAIWRYSGGGYTVVQQLLEDVIGRPFPQLMRDRVLRPLGMRQSAYVQPLPYVRAVQAATGYRADGEAISGRFHVYPEMAAAGLWTTPSDLMRYVMGVNAAWNGAENGILSRDMARQMLTEQIGGWGLGPAVADTGRDLHFSHGGANEGFRALVVGWPARGQGAAIMSNSDAGGALNQEILRAIARAYGWPDYGPRTITEQPLQPGEAGAFAGRYRIPGQDAAVVVTASGDRLELAVPGEANEVYARTEPDTFVGLMNGGTIRFEREGGVVVALRGRGLRLPKER